MTTAQVFGDIAAVDHARVVGTQCYAFVRFRSPADADFVMQVNILTSCSSASSVFLYMLYHLRLFTSGRPPTPSTTCRFVIDCMLRER